MSKSAWPSNDVLTLSEAARFVRVSQKTLGEMARSRQIPCQKVGREWRFLRQALEGWLRGKAEPSYVAEPQQAYGQAVLFDEAPPDRDSKLKTCFSDTAFTKNRQEPIHRWVPWIAGFSAAFVRGVLNGLVSAPPREVIVLDPFAGVGTTLVEGLKQGYNVTGFEINAYASLACQVTLQAASCNLRSLSKTIEQLGRFMRDKRRSKQARPKSNPPPAFRSKNPFFSPSVERQVLFLQDFIGSVSEEPIRDLVKVAFGAVMVSFSNYTYEPSLGTRSAAGKRDITDADVGQIVAAKLRQMATDIAFLQRRLAGFSYEPSAMVHSRSYLTPADSLRAQSVDILITSPPYLNNYHYVRNTRPQLHWLGLVKARRDLKQIEVGSFGQFWQTVRAGSTVELTVDIPELRRVVDMIREQNPEKGVYGGRGWANYAATYFNDCARFCAVTRELMKPGGHVVVVIGNNILQGVEVKTEEFFAQIAELHGFEIVELHKVRRKRTGSSIVNSSVRAGMTKKRVELHETAVQLRAPGS